MLTHNCPYPCSLSLFVVSFVLGRFPFVSAHSFLHLSCDTVSFMFHGCPVAQDASEKSATFVISCKHLHFR